MAAYWVARAKINDPVECKKYTNLVPAIITRNAAARFSPVAGATQINEGTARLPSLRGDRVSHAQQGVACFESPEYQHAAAFRRAGAGVVENVMVDGGDATQ